MLSRIDQISKDGCFTQGPAGFETMQAFHQHEAISIATQQDWCLLTGLQNAFGNFFDGLGIERGSTLRRNVDIRDGE
jgi:hypothetical protein